MGFCMTPAQRLHNVIAAVAPIDGISIGVLGNTASVRIDFKQSATDPQKAAAQTALQSFDWSDAAQTAAEEAAQPERTTLVQQAAQAVIDIDTYLALASPTN